MSSSNRRKYLTATVLDQAFLDECADNLENRLEMVVDIQRPDGGFIRASDRNKYIDGVFYQALLKFPVISRTVGEWLAPDLQFSTLTLELSNVDGRFNDVLPGGANYGSWVGRSVTVKLGVGEIGTAYKTIFQGSVSDEGGFRRGVKTITLIARDKYETINVNFPTSALTKTGYPNLDDGSVGIVLPVIYGDWTVGLDTEVAVIPSYPVNLGDSTVINAPWNNIQLRISENDLTFFDTSNVYLNRGDTYYLVPSADVVNVGAGNKTFEINQDTANLWVDGAAYNFEVGDQFLVRVKGKDLGAYDDNIVWQARDLLMTYGGVGSGDFDANWTTFRDKSVISATKSRVWENEPKPVMQYALSMLEQVRLEAFISKDLLIKINSLHFDDFVASPTYDLKNWDIVKDTFDPQLDEKNNFNRAQGVYNFFPSRNENAVRTAFYKNAASVTAIGKTISKQITFPNLYEEAKVVENLTEILKIASALFEFVPLQTTWRSMLLDIGDFVSLNVDIGGAVFENVPAMVREIGYDPAGLKIPLVVWSFALLPFSGYTPGYPGTVGGISATIVQE